MKRDSVALREMMHRATRAFADVVDEYGVDDDSVHTVTCDLEELAHEYLGVPRALQARTGRDALEHLLEQFEVLSADAEDEEQF